MKLDDRDSITVLAVAQRSTKDPTQARLVLVVQTIPFALVKDLGTVLRDATNDFLKANGLCTGEIVEQDLSPDAPTNEPVTLPAVRTLQ